MEQPICRLRPQIGWMASTRFRRVLLQTACAFRFQRPIAPYALTCLRGLCQSGREAIASGAPEMNYNVLVYSLYTYIHSFYLYIYIYYIKLDICFLVDSLFFLLVVPIPRNGRSVQISPIGINMQ